MACPPNTICRNVQTSSRTSRLSPNPFAQAPAYNYSGQGFVSAASPVAFTTTRSRKTYRNTPVFETGPSTRAVFAAPTYAVKSQYQPVTTRRARSWGAGLLTRSQASPISYIQQAPIQRGTARRTTRRLLGKTPTTLVQETAAPAVQQVVYDNSARYSPRTTLVQAPIETTASASFESSVPSYNVSPRYSPVYDRSAQVQVVSGPSYIPSSSRYTRTRAISVDAPRGTVYSKDNLPPLPAVNSSCCRDVVVPRSRSTHENVNLGTENRVINLYDKDVKTIVREINHHKTFNKTVVTTVNRNHEHTNRVVENHNNHNTYLTHNVIRVKDIHRQRVEKVAGATKNFNKQKQTQRVEPAVCDGCSNENGYEQGAYVQNGGYVQVQDDQTQYVQNDQSTRYYSRPQASYQRYQTSYQSPF